VNDGWDLLSLEGVIRDRKTNPQTGSYTTALFEAGINKVAQKVGEEAVEMIIESKDSNRTLFLNEAADLMYHYLVLLSAKDCSMNDVLEVLKKRHKK
jgi:phosphoribosyl-ATP pyrophosphohydrolase/phosphoribosyl-AMP cyclohydrolase